MYGVWYYGEQVCKTYLIMIIDWATSTVSVCAIVLISYDRYVLVTKGLEYDKIQTRRKFYITSITLLTICFIRYMIHNIAYDYWRGKPSDNYSVECRIPFEYLFEVELITLCVNILLPITLIIFFNITNLKNIKDRSRGLPRNWGSSVRPWNTFDTEEIGNQPVRSKAEGTSDLRKLRRSVLTLGVIVGVAILCWIPFHVYVILTLWGVEVNSTLASSTYYIWYLNSTVNPFLNVATNPGMRRRFFKILRFAR